MRRTISVVELAEGDEFIWCDRLVTVAHIKLSETGRSVHGRRGRYFTIMLPDESEKIVHFWDSESVDELTAT